MNAEKSPQRAQQLGGARADFVASLGRKVADARAVLTTLEEDPANANARDELRRRIHALGSGARLLRFEALTTALGVADAILVRVAKTGKAKADDLTDLAQVLDDLPALAWSDPARTEETVRDLNESTGTKTQTFEHQALVFGSEMFAETLSEIEEGETGFECERCDDFEQTLAAARSLAPDVVLVDADEPRALELVEFLLEDPMTEPVPIVVVGTFSNPEAAARYVAMGTANTLSKPVEPERVRRACADAVAAREGRTIRLSLGEPTLEQLGERLAEELREALVHSVERGKRTTRVNIGEGTEVMGALWGAIARIREVVTARTDGTVRFAGRGPEGTLAFAPWLHQEPARGDRNALLARGPAADVRLQGRRVVVADDDPGVTWFISDLLRTAGCIVEEALDGQSALERAFELQPDLVVSDILMPGLDGFALTRALRRDVALRDTPVVLLSWKEDLLQRVRELGANAAAYLRKEADSRAVVARVREVLRPRARIEARIRAPGEVRGRLDTITVRTLLEVVVIARPNARVTLRDASFHYEFEIREGSLCKATRTSSDGGFTRGAHVLAAALGVGAGRFTVVDARAPIGGADFEGPLADLLTEPVARARAAALASTGARLGQVERVLFEPTGLDEYLRVTPDPARLLVRALSDGASPRTILVGGDTEPALLEDVLSDLAGRGMIVGVLGVGGVDLLGSVAESMRERMEQRAMSGPPHGASGFRSAPPRTKDSRAENRPSTGPSPRSSRSPATTLAESPSARMRTLSIEEPRPRLTPAPPSVRGSRPPPSIRASAPPLEASAGDAAVPAEPEDSNSSLADAVLRELAESSPSPPSVGPTRPSLQAAATQEAPALRPSIPPTVSPPPPPLRGSVPPGTPPPPPPLRPSVPPMAAAAFRSSAPPPPLRASAPPTAAPPPHAFVGAALAVERAVAESERVGTSPSEAARTSVPPEEAHASLPPQEGTRVSRSPGEIGPPSGPATPAAIGRADDEPQATSQAPASVNVAEPRAALVESAAPVEASLTDLQAEDSSAAAVIPSSAILTSSTPSDPIASVPAPDDTDPVQAGANGEPAEGTEGDPKEEGAPAPAETSDAAAQGLAGSDGERGEPVERKIPPAAPTEREPETRVKAVLVSKDEVIADISDIALSVPPSRPASDGPPADVGSATGAGGAPNEDRTDRGPGVAKPSSLEPGDQGSPERSDLPVSVKPGGARSTGPISVQPALPTNPRPPWVWVLLLLAGIAGFAALTRNEGGSGAVTDPTITFSELPENLKVEPGQGVLELETSGASPVEIGGVVRGNGPHLQVPLDAGTYSVNAGARAPLEVEIRPGQVSRVRLTKSP